MSHFHGIARTAWRVGTVGEALDQFPFLLLPAVAYLVWIGIAAAFLVFRFGNPWIGALVPPVLILGSLVSSVWLTCAILYWPPLSVVADAPTRSHLRKRLFAWSALVASGTLLLLSLGAGVIAPLGRFFPSSFYPAVEVSVLILTAILLGLLTHYTVESSALQTRTLGERINDYGVATTSAIESVGGRIEGTFRTETRRLSEDFRASTSDVRGAVDAVRIELGSVRTLLERQLAELAELRWEQQRASDLARQESDTARERQRGEEAREVIQRRLREQEAHPRLGGRLRHEGTFFHHLILDLRNTGPVARDCRIAFGVEGLGEGRILPLTTLAHAEAKAFDLGDVTSFPNEFNLIVEAHYADLHGCAYTSQARFVCRRDVGILNRTRSMEFDPPIETPLVDVG